MAIETLDSNQQVALQFKDTFPQELPQGYHLDNFLVLIQDISNRYHDLLSQEENSWIENFLELSQNAQSLLVRLIMRKGPFFRCDKLKYEDIKDLITTQKELAEKQFIKINDSIPIESLLALCLKAELASTYTYLFDSKASQAKNQLVEELLNETREDSKLQEKIVALINQQFEWVERLHNDKIRRFLILFFGNSRQGLTEFVTSQLGIIQYETYSIEQENRFFQTRQRLDHLEQLAIIQDWQDDRLSIATIDEIQAQIDKLVSLLKASENIDHYVNHKIQRAITRITRQLERLDPEEALKAYHYSLAPPSRERQARILEKLGRYQEALDLVLAIESSPQHPDEAEKTIPLKTKLLKRLNQEIKPTNQLNINECYLRLSYQDPEKNIEQQVAEHFIKQGYPCLHTENQLFLGLFGL
ncbi:MAG: hypothetical protein MI867_21100, partial [Pseudomonadales bacterium]|nr:hypothetical protein [Pseudomonadales bacterium]